MIETYKLFELEYNKEEKILKIFFKKGSSIYLETAKKAVEHSSVITNNEPHANCADLSQMMYISKDARKFFAQSDKSSVICIAVIINSKFQKSMGNFYMKINKPIIKTQLFDSEPKAIEWLKEQINKQQNKNK